MSRTGQLWWIADNADELANMVVDVLAESGTINDVQRVPEGFDVLVTVARQAAVRKGWAVSVDADNWLEDDDEDT